LKDINNPEVILKLGRKAAGNNDLYQQQAIQKTVFVFWSSVNFDS
jgi:hypothetical protein